MTTSGMSIPITTDDAIIAKTPLFPGAYISNYSEAGTGHSIPIYHSIPSTTNDYSRSIEYGFENQVAYEGILYDKDRIVTVMPGYKLEVYQMPDYGPQKSGGHGSYEYDNINYYTLDNTNGTELLYHKTTTSDPSNVDLEIKSCKLFYKDRDNIVREVIPLKHTTLTTSNNSNTFNISTLADRYESLETEDLTYNGINYKLVKFYYGGKIINTGPDIEVKCLLVAGGGSGGWTELQHYGSGGGGAGGYGHGTIILKQNVTYDISVGPGGCGKTVNGPGGNPGVDSYIKGSDGIECRSYSGGCGVRSVPNTNMGNNSNNGLTSGSTGGEAFYNGTDQHWHARRWGPLGGLTTNPNNIGNIKMKYYANNGGHGNEGGGSGGGAGAPGILGAEGTVTGGVKGGIGKMWIDRNWYAVGGGGGPYSGSSTYNGADNWTDSSTKGTGNGGKGTKGTHNHTNAGSSGICIFAIPM